MDRISALPVDLLVNRRVKTLRLVCPDRSSSIAVAADAFRASRNLTERLDIERCTVQSLAFLTDFVRLNALSVHDTAMTNLIDVPYLANLTTVDVTDNPNFSNWYYPSQTPSVTSITIKSTLNDMSASRIFDSNCFSFYFLAFWEHLPCQLLTYFPDRFNWLYSYMTILPDELCVSIFGFVLCLKQRGWLGSTSYCFAEFPA